MSNIDDVLSRYRAMRKAADDFTDGEIDGDDLHSAVVDYTDAVGGLTITYNSMGQIVRVQA